MLVPLPDLSRHGLAVPGFYGLRSASGNTEYLVVIMKGKALFGEQMDGSLVGLLIPDNAQPTQGTVVPYSKLYPGRTAVQSGVQDWTNARGAFDRTHLSIEGSYSREGRQAELHGKMIFGVSLRLTFSADGKCTVDKGELRWLESIDLTTGKSTTSTPPLLPLVSCSMISAGN